MAHDKALAKQKLTQLWENEQVKVLDTNGKKYAIMSDIHLGDGGKADNFHENEQALDAALQHYYANNYELILLGDIEELWQFELPEIENRYRGTIYRRIKDFGDDRVHRVWGNHDAEWGLIDPTVNRPVMKFAEEAIKMRDSQGRLSFLLLHGHQGDIFADKYSWVGRTIARAYRGVEEVKRAPQPSIPQSEIVTDFEQIFYAWAKVNKVILICGHSHRAIFASKSHAEHLKDEIGELQKEILANRQDEAKVKGNIKKIEKKLAELLEESTKGRDIEPTDPDREPLPCYFNCGCTLYDSGITILEIADDDIKLVKWHKEAREPRFEEYQSGKLSEYVSRLHPV